MGAKVDHSQCIFICCLPKLEQFGGFLNGPQLVLHCLPEVVVMAPVFQTGYIVAAQTEYVHMYVHR